MIQGLLVKDSLEEQNVEEAINIEESIIVQPVTEEPVTNFEIRDEPEKGLTNSINKYIFNIHFELQVLKENGLSLKKITKTHLSSSRKENFL